MPAFLMQRGSWCNVAVVKLSLMPMGNRLFKLLGPVFVVLHVCRIVAGEWAVSMGGPFSDSAAGVAVDGAGNCFVAGAFQGPATFGLTNLSSMGENNSFLAKFTPDGSFLWVAQIAICGADQAPTSVADDVE